MNKAIAVAVAGAFVSHDLGRHDLAHRDEHRVQLIVSHCLKAGLC